MGDEERSGQKMIEGEHAAEGRRQPPDEPMLYCPVCSTRLAEMKCKLVCNKCGYYMSCADYY
jgi:hypothetical protein